MNIEQANAEYTQDWAECKGRHISRLNKVIEHLEAQLATYTDGVVAELEDVKIFNNNYGGSSFDCWAIEEGYYKVIIQELKQ